MDTNEDEAGHSDTEPFPLNGGQPAVHIRNLRKVYAGGKVAVESLTLETL